MQKLGIYWFGQDLRINDNLGLKTAAMEADQLLCIAFIQPKTRNPNHPIPVNLAPVRLKYPVSYTHLPLPPPPYV